MRDRVKRINVEHNAGDSDFPDVYAEIFKRQVQRRSPVDISLDSHDEPDLRWTIDPELNEETFSIQRDNNGVVVIRGGRARGLLYGIGKFLRTSGFSQDGMILSDWQGASSPAKEFRCSYFASHFNNYYQDAPLPEIERYVEELGLWGFNTVGAWFDYHQFSSFQDPQAQKTFQHICGIIRTVNRLDLKMATGFLANEAYNNSPKALRATPTGRSFYGVELCPNKPGSVELLLKWFAEELRGYIDAGVKVDHFGAFPYDQGGCGCDICKPWGANGYLFMAEKISRLTKQYFPHSTFSINTWLFDHKRDQGEWRGLTEAFRTPPDWVDYLQAGAHGTFPSYPLEHGVPGNLPVFDFPEISMWGMYPWGGFGANPLPNRFQGLWGTICDRVVGARLYSEGLYEDFNKVLYSRFLWHGNNEVDEAMREYFRYECGCRNPEEITDAIYLLEKNHAPMWFTENYVRRYKCSCPPIPNDYGGYAEPLKIDRETADAALAICTRVDERLPAWGREGWRWRIIFLRAVIDAELHNNEGNPTPACEEAFAELTRIYHAENGEAKVSPPTREAMAADRTTVAFV